jgi:hypothetical protein
MESVLSVYRASSDLSCSMFFGKQVNNRPYRSVLPGEYVGLHPIASAFYSGYSHSMNNKNHFFTYNKTGYVLGAALLVALTECAGNAYGQNARVNVGINVAPPVVVAPAIVVTPPGMQDNYVYYPSYGVYYNSSRRQYAYQDKGAWVSRSSPNGVSADVLQASPSVKMDFHDSPGKHHAEMVQKYPKNWTSPGADHGKK